MVDLCRRGVAAAVGLATVLAVVTAFAPVASAQLSPGPLSRAHADLEGVTNCLKCHGIGSAALDDRCLACHDAIRWLREGQRGLHGVEDGKQCIECHGEHGGRSFEVIHWESGSPERFDHRRTGWPLGGKHAQLQCRACHHPKYHATSFPDASDWQGTERSWLGLEPQCQTCHADPHLGRLGERCVACHNETDFHQIAELRFDHENTRYPLRGAHADVKCESCHERVDGQLQMPRFERCDACHRDPHAGQNRLAEVTRDCDECHSLRYFRPSTLGIEYHASTEYPLEGKHVRVDCDKCHHDKSDEFGRAAFEFRPTAAHCTDCHEDAHRGQLDGRADRGACETCHVVEEFAPSRFSVADHDQTDFPLRERHREIACADCHGPERKGLTALPGADVLGSARVALKLLESECEACHRDPHRGRFSPGGEEPVEGGCLACHDERSFRRVDVDPELHARLGFALDGAHAAVPCFECHREMTDGAPSTLLLLAPRSLYLPFTAPRTCAECHEDIHGGQFAGRERGVTCDICHGADRFRPATRFDHDRDSSFELVGAHDRVACSGCHLTGTLPDGRTGILYTPVPVRCEECHTIPPPPLDDGAPG